MRFVHFLLVLAIESITPRANIAAQALCAMISAIKSDIFVCLARRMAGGCHG
jgi:hypothetical protein